MARPVSILKKSYYPTPEHLVPLISQYLKVETKNKADIRLLDPCCGEGKALHILSTCLDLPSRSLYGVELDEERFKEAKKLIPNCLFGDSITEFKAAPNSFSLLYENPPYDYENTSEKGRTEFKFLQAHYRFLAPGGILVYLVPEYILSRPEFIQSIPVWFKNIRIFRFPPEEYKQFKQVILFGVKNRKVDHREKENYIKQLTNPLTLGDPCDIIYYIPSVTTKLNSFYTKSLCPEQIKDIYKTSMVQNLIRQHSFSHLYKENIKSLMPLRLGHMVLLLAGGELDGLYKNPETGELLLIKGTTEIVENTQTLTRETPDGEETIEITLKKPVSKIYALNLTKTIENKELYFEEYL